MAQITYTNPTWALLDSAGVPNTVTHSASTTLGYQGGQPAAEETAFEFCHAFDYSLVGYVVGGNTDPTVTYDISNELWEDDSAEPQFLQITCDNGIPDSIVEVNIANVGDLIFLLGILVSVGIMQVTLLVFGRN